MNEDIFDEKPKKLNSKVKGNKNEVAVAKWLGKWTGKQFRRTPMSGAIGATFKGVSGDVVVIDNSDFLFCVEAKSYKKIPLTGFLRQSSYLYNFWEQALRDAKNVDKETLLIVRVNGMPKDEWVVYFETKTIGNKIRKLGIKHCATSVQGGRYDITGFNTKELIKLNYKDLE